MSGILLGVGIIAKAYIKIGYFEIITIPIYLAIGVMLPLWLGIASALLIDVLSMVISGTIGTWYWTFGLEPPMVVMIAFGFKYMFSLFKSQKTSMYFAIVFTMAIIIGSIVVISMHYDELSFQHKNWESDDAFTRRMVKRYGSLIGLLFLVIMSIREITLIYRNKSNDNRKNAFILVILTSLIFDWFYHPWAVYQWELNVLNVPKSQDLYTTHFVTGIWASTFHISLGIPVMASILFISNNITYNKKDRF